MWKEISETEFNAAVSGLRQILGGEMFGGGSYAEFGSADERSTTHRSQIAGNGSQSWFRFRDS